MPTPAPAPSHEALCRAAMALPILLREEYTNDPLALLSALMCGVRPLRLMRVMLAEPEVFPPEVVATIMDGVPVPPTDVLLEDVLANDPAAEALLRAFAPRLDYIDLGVLGTELGNRPDSPVAKARLALLKDLRAGHLALCVV